MKKQISRRMFALATTATLLTSFAMLGLRWRDGLQELTEQTSRQAAIAAAGYQSAATPSQALYTIGSADLSRITLIDANGFVTYDSNANANEMENHWTRPEVQQARQTGWGQDTRISSTLNQLTCYVALRLSNGEILRVANTTDLVSRSIIDTIPTIFAVTLIIILLSALLSSRLTNQLVRPINAIDPSHPLANPVYDELHPLLHRLNTQNEQITQQISALKQKQVELDAILSGIEEGLILLDANQQVLICSRSACHLLDTQVVLGTSFADFIHDPCLLDAAQTACSGTSNAQLIECAGRHLRFSFSPVRVDGQIRGIVLLILDISSQYAAEQSRRTFTANVTHELKTPLTSVLGYAEMIRYGLAQPDDIPCFAARIHNEAARLLALVDDIMKLSRLDEGRSTLSFHPIDLYALAQCVCDRMEDTACRYQVQLQLEGQSCIIAGVPTMVDEVLSNLCDNAIKYNHTNGYVKISIQPEHDAIVLQISNTGTPISPQALPHIFERFYRADASRSQEIPGTGLGLSIVKHICEIHQATISVTSDPQATTFTIRWRLEGN